MYSVGRTHPPQKFDHINVSYLDAEHMIMYVLPRPRSQNSRMGSVPKVVEKRKGISYPIADESKTGASGGPRKGGYAVERRISHWARVDHGRPGVVP